MRRKAVYMMPRRFGRDTILQAVRATGDDALTPEQHRALFEGMFSIEARDRDLVELADDYHHRVEAFERTVCNGRIDNEVMMLANHHELTIIKANAQSIRQEMIERALALGFTEAQFKESLMHHIRKSVVALNATAARQEKPTSWVRMSASNEDYLISDRIGVTV